MELSLSIPIWNRLSKHSTISRKQHALDKATAELDQKRRDVESEVRRPFRTVTVLLPLTSRHSERLRCRPRPTP